MAGWGQEDHPSPGSCLREGVRGAGLWARAKGLPNLDPGVPDLGNRSQQILLGAGACRVGSLFSAHWGEEKQRED